MREVHTNGQLSVRAISGAHVVVLAWDVVEANWSAFSEGLLGFAIQRIEHDGAKMVATRWLQGMKRFESTDKDAPAGASFPLSKQPLQSFQWGDYTARPGVSYTYRVVPTRGLPEKLTLEDAAAVEVKIKTEVEDDGNHGVWFNRGVAASQEYSRKFSKTPPDPDDPKSEQMKWLSRGLYEALCAFIAEAKDGDFALRGALYEFHYAPVLTAFKEAIDRGVDVAVIYDEPNYGAENAKAIGAAGIEAVCRPRAGSTANKHNKFIVLTHKNEPVAAWTGSTNISAGGIFGHSNVGHLVRDRSVAKQFLDCWSLLSANLSAPAKTLKPLLMKMSPTPATTPPPPGINVMFSPRDGTTLDWYASLMDTAERVMCFTVAFTVATPFELKLENPTNDLRFILKDAAAAGDAKITKDEDVLVAIGSRFAADSFAGWLGEKLTGFNTHVEYIHDKFMLVDPLGDDPIVVTGSANFSTASMIANDENMLAIRGEKRVADIYFGEFMRLFDHLYARYLVERARKKGKDAVKNFLIPDASWLEKYAGDTSPKAKKRLYFRGTV